MLLLVFQEFDFLFAFLGFNVSALFVSLLNSFNLGLEFGHFILELSLLVFELLNSFLQLRLSMFGLQLFSHSECYRALVEGLIGGNSHFNFISHSEQKKASLWLAQSNLTDDFIETLRKQFFSDRANAALSSLAFHQLLVKHLSESGDVDSRCRLVAHILNIMLASFNPLTWGKDGVQNVFTAGFGVHRWEVAFFATYSYKMVSALIFGDV